MKFRKKPVVIEATCNHGNHELTEAWVREVGGSPGILTLHTDGAVTIDTLEGTMRADVGDWIIRGIQGEFYPVKPDIFAATYELA
jgi:hypothetical protein